MKKLTFLIPLLCLPTVLHAENAPELKARILEQQRQLETELRSQSQPDTIYRLTKARVWLDLALDELHEDDRTGIVEAAIAEARRLATADNNAAADTPILRGSERIREDLWQKSAQMKQHQDSDCAMRELAQLDVQLVWAGHEKWESGWTHAKPYVEVAENLAYEAEQEIARCSEARKPKLAEVPAAGAAITVTVEKFTFATDALFQFDKAGVEQMAAGGEKKLAALADALKSWKSIEQLEVGGHTDRIGSETYNDKLSRQRADNVRDYLIKRGLPAEKISASGRGESEPLVECKGEKRTADLIACLQPNRRVEITVRGEKQGRE